MRQEKSKSSGKEDTGKRKIHPKFIAIYQHGGSGCPFTVSMGESVDVHQDKRCTSPLICYPVIAPLCLLQVLATHRHQG